MHGDLRPGSLRDMPKAAIDRAIVLEELGSTAALPAGWTDVQARGGYRLAR